MTADNATWWMERMRKNQEPSAAWARRWNILAVEGCDRPGATTYTGYAGYVSPGWIPLLDNLAQDLIALGWDRRLAGVKQKFGGLRFYIDRVDPKCRDAINRRIEEAEAESFKTCEECSAPARPGGEDSVRGWLRTLCPRCFDVEDSELRARCAEEEQDERGTEARLEAEEDEAAKSAPEFRAYLEEHVWPLRFEKRSCRPLYPEEIKAAVAAHRCGVCGRDLSHATWTAETGEHYRRSGRCSRCPLPENDGSTTTGRVL